MKVNFIGDSKGAVDLNDQVFSVDYKPSLVHQAIQSLIENQHTGTKKQKTRSEVRGGGAKPRRQKGGGCSRMGTIRSPILRGGGRAFAARVVHRTHKLNKKMYRGAMCSLLSQLYREERIKVVEELNIEAPKTKLVAQKLASLDLNQVLVVLHEANANFIMGAANLPHVSVVTVDQLAMLDLLYFDQILFTEPAIARCEERLS